MFSPEDIMRVTAFALVFIGIATWELITPRRSQRIDRRHRWPANLEIAALNVLLVRIASPVAATGVAVTAQRNGWGCANLCALPTWLAAPLTFVALDLTIFAQHVVLHRVPWLWRLHQVHHADLALDVTTGVRFHPGEIVVSLLVKMLAVLALGPAPITVLAFEIALNATSMFSHSNVRLSPGIDRLLRWVLVTPDMHRVHHSVRAEELNSNFGFNLSCWDRLFGTYRAQPRDGHDAMQLGVERFRGTADTSLPNMLRQPWQ